VVGGKTTTQGTPSQSNAYDGGKYDTGSSRNRMRERYSLDSSGSG
jgi:hypothetical protein